MLLEKNFEPFDILTGTKAPDGRSGTHTVWSVTGGFSGVAVIGQTAHDRARQTDVTAAQAQIPKPLYSILTRRAVLLPFYAVIRRRRDGKYFRILSGAADAETPKCAKLDLRMFAAEEFRLPDGGRGNDQSTGNP